jgi:hypothetical protein
MVTPAISIATTPPPEGTLVPLTIPAVPLWMPCRNQTPNSSLSGCGPISRSSNVFYRLMSSTGSCNNSEGPFKPNWLNWTTASPCLRHNGP